MLDLRDQTFGVEIELTGITRERAAKVIARYFGTKAKNEASTFGYYTWAAKDFKGRTWKCLKDASIFPQRKINGHINNTHDQGYKCEVVTPILKYEDMEDLQNIVRLLRVEGAIANSSTGIHVHVGADKHNVKSLQNLVKLVASKEDLIYEALNILPNREQNYTRKVDKVFLKKMLDEKPQSMQKLEAEWYNGKIGFHPHYDNTRYHGLNLHAVFTKGTVEFRLFNGSTHAGKIKAYVQFCLALSAMAINAKASSYKKTVTDNPKYTFRCFLLRLGLIGDEFKTCRLHLMQNLTGNAAWRNGRAA